MKGLNYTVWVLCYLFFVVGSVFCMNDVLFPHIKDHFQLTYVQATYIQLSFYVVYLVFPIPISYALLRLGYKYTILLALFICSIGCILFYPAYAFDSYPLVLTAILVISTGVSVINVAANPLAALAGTPDNANLRINFVQAFSRLGYSVTPFVGFKLLTPGCQGCDVVFYLPFIVLFILFFGVIMLFFRVQTPEIDVSVPEMNIIKIFKESRQYRNLFWGTIVMFFYVGAEACTSSFYISYLTTEVGQTIDEASLFLTYYYVLAALFGFIGVLLLRFVTPGKLVLIFGTGMVICFMICILAVEPLNIYAFPALGIFLSVMFPTLFGMGIEGVGNFTEKGSALLNIAIVGGAIFPMMQGYLADTINVRTSYIVPMICFLVIMVYGYFFRKMKTN